MAEVFIISAVRTPFDSGVFADPSDGINLPDLLMHAAVGRAGIDAGRLEDSVWAGPFEPGNLPKRTAVGARGLFRLPVMAVNRPGAGSQQALHSAAQQVLAGDADLVMACGFDKALGMGAFPSWEASLESEAEAAGFSRQELDDYSYESCKRAKRAVRKGWFERQVISNGNAQADRPQQDALMFAPASRRALASLPPVGKPGGLFTLGNSARACDGAAILVLASVKAVGRYNLSPLARIAARCVVDCEAALQGSILVTRRALQQAGLGLDEVDIVEVDESFAALVLGWAREFQPSMERLNPTGGALAFGHAREAAGAVWITRLAHELARTRQQYGLFVASAPGVALATVIERV